MLQRLKTRIIEWFDAFELKYHDCKDHKELIKTYQDEMKFDNGCSLAWMTGVYKCKVCGEKWRE